MGSICIIPARGGSKRIPRKNIKDFLGKPIIAYSIEAAVNSNLFDEVMVSTDDVEISETARLFGATVPFMRSEANANDFATTFDVVQEVLEAYNSIGKSFDFVCCLYPCAPLVEEQNLVKAYHKLTANVDAVVPVVAFSFPIQRAFRTQDEYLMYMHPEYEKSRSQDLERAYHDVGQFYFFKSEPILKECTLVPQKTTYLILDEMQVQDIDNMADWKLAELKYRLKNDEVSG